MWSYFGSRKLPDHFSYHVCGVISEHDPMIREKRNIIIPTRYLSTSITQFHSSSFKKMSALIYDLCYKALGMVWNNAWRYITKETLVLPKERCSDLRHSWHRKLVLMKAPYDYLKSDKIFNHLLEKFFIKNEISFHFSFSFSFFAFHHPSSFCFFIYGRPLWKQPFPTYQEVTALNLSSYDLARLSQIGISHLSANSYWKLLFTLYLSSIQKGDLFSPFDGRLTLYQI